MTADSFRSKDLCTRRFQPKRRRLFSARKSDTSLRWKNPRQKSVRQMPKLWRRIGPSNHREEFSRHLRGQSLPQAEKLREQSESRKEIYSRRTAGISKAFFAPAAI